MANFNLTPNMKLPNPVPGVDPGPDYASNLQSSLNIIDDHDHSVGSGVQITPSGISINTSLPFNGQNAITLRSTQYNNYVSTLSGGTTPASVATSIDQCSVYFSGGDFYINNSAGTAVKVTSGSSVNAGAGSITGLPSGTASVTFTSGTYVFQSATSTAANIDVGSVVLRSGSASSHGLTLSPPSSLSGGDFTLILPGIPAAQSFITLDTGGNFTGYTPINQGITRANLAPVGQQGSASSGFFFNTTSTFQTAISVTITTSGRPVIVIVQSDGSGTNSYLASINAPGNGTLAEFRIKRGATVVANYELDSTVTIVPATTNTNSIYVPANMVLLDVPSASTVTYTLDTRTMSSGTAVVNNAVIIAYEL